MKGVWVGLTATVLAIAQGTSASATCSIGDGTRMQGPPDALLEIAIALPSKDIPLSAPFQADILVCSKKSGLPSRITVDATMPAHKHGMNYEPKVLKAENGRYEIRNLLFHMPGVWRFEVTAYLDGKPLRYIHDVTLE